MRSVQITRILQTSMINTMMEMNPGLNTVQSRRTLPRKVGQGRVVRGDSYWESSSVLSKSKHS